MSLLETAFRKRVEEFEMQTSTAMSDNGRDCDKDGLGVTDNRPLVQRRVEKPELDLSPQFLEDAGLRAPRKHLHQQIAEYRHVKRQLMNSMKSLTGESRQVIMLASALSGDGKTHSAFNLAHSIAMEPDYSVLLIDADVIEPKLTRTFQLEDRDGFMDAVMNGEVSPESLVVSTNIDGLSILPAGRRAENATEYFASKRMRDCINSLSRPRNRILVIDSLPLLLTTEARVLMPYAGQIVLVVRANVTPQAAVQQSVELLGEHEHVNLLLNDVDIGLLGSHVYSNYHYRYGYGQPDEKE